MPQISTSATIPIPAGSRLVFDAGGQAAATLLHGASGQPVQSIDIGRSAQVVGPFSATMSLSVSAVRPVSYSVQVQQFESYESTDAAPVSQAAGTGSLLGANGAEAIRTDDLPGADALRSPPEHFTSSAAISTTATIRITPTGVRRVARITWLNNGGSGAGVMYLAANCANDVEGLVASQSPKQRDAQLSIGGSLQIVSPTPITSLNFSTDIAYTAATHLLMVSFGE